MGTILTFEVESAYVHWNDSGSKQSRDAARLKFNTWLAEHDAKIRIQTARDIQAQMLESQG